MHRSVIARKLHLLAGASVALTAMAMAPPARAQDEAIEESGLAEIVVTARKREENLQDTPIAITAITADALAARGLNDLSQVAASTPNLAFSTAPQNANKGSASVFLRGVGQLDYRINTDPGVGIYVDGVYLARSIGSMLDFIDVERIEVLRGPQGTLFGRNTIGGAINVISAAPSDEAGGSATFTTGSYDRMQVQATANLPITEELLSRFTLYGHVRDGYMTRVQTGDDVGDDNVWGGRAQFRWTPSADFTADFSIDGTSRDENAGPLKLLDAAAFGFAANDTRNIAPVPNPPSAFNNSIGGVCSTAAADTSLNCFGAAWVTSDPYTTNDTFGDRTTLDIFGTNLTLDWDTGPVNIRSISAYRHLEAVMQRDTDHTPFDLFYFATDDEADQISQELQFSGATFNDRLNWLVGLYYFNESGVEIYDNYNRAGFRALANVDIDNTSIAVFTENTLDVTDWLHLTAGLRWTRDTKDYSIDIPVIEDFNLAVPPALGALIVADNSTQEASFERVTPRITLAADATEDLMVYVTYSEGYKSGGYNAIYSAPVPAPIPFDPEDVSQYEIGVKFETDTLRLNLAAFHSNYSDIQVNYRPNPAQILTVVGNAAGGEIDGIEAEFTWAPIHGLTLQGGLGWIDAHYTEIDPGLVPVGINLSTPFVNTPELSGSLSASYEMSLGAMGSLTPRIDYSYRDDVVYDNTNSPPARQEAISLVNANITWRSTDERWRLIFGSTNLTDETYLVTAAYNRAAGVAEGLYGRPREWYLSLRREF